MAGGKYTTFRKISQEIADFAFPDTHTDEAISKEHLSTPEEYRSRFGGEPVWGKYDESWFRWKKQFHCPVLPEDLWLRRSPVWLAGNVEVEKVKAKLQGLGII
jgi:hypothetical protein